MKILCFLDSTHYTDPEYIRVSDTATKKEIEKFVENKLKDDLAWECGKERNPVIIWMDEGKRAEISVMLSENDRFFEFCEIKEIPDADFISAYHTAYENTEFVEVKGFDSIDEARKYSAKRADEVKKDLRKVASDERELNFINIDDEYQWHMFTSELVKEKQIKAAA